MRVIAKLQDQFAGFIGVAPVDRVTMIEGMLGRSASDVVGYWLQLLLSMGIATLGLAMDSTAVVIGAMLISPLMTPLIELGAGLATGSLVLAIRAGVRTVGSVAVVVLGAAGMTQLLPFHEITTELAARTSPTLLDLFVAVFCALAAVYTTVRQSKDVMSAAAGTAIGISLVPPLCTAGYGLGVARGEVFRGGLLLFTANFAAIAAVATIALLSLGFGQVPMAALEGAQLAAPENHRVSHRAARLTRRIVGRRLGVLRLLIPAVLLGAILVPLMTALEEVSWQVRVRSQVEDALAAVPGAVVRQSLEVRGGEVRVRLFLVGDADDAAQIRAELRAQIAAISGREPVVEVVAVPDAVTLDAMASQLRTLAAPRIAAAVTIAPRLADALVDADAAVRAGWPSSAGPLVRVRVESRPAGGPIVLELTHLGPPLGVAGEQLLAEQSSTRLGAPVVLVDRAVPAAPVEAADRDVVPWLAEAARLVGLAGDVDGLWVCLTTPAPAAPPTDRRARPVAPDPALAVVRAAAEALPRSPTVQHARGDGWRVAVQREPCVAADATPPGG